MRILLAISLLLPVSLAAQIVPTFGYGVGGYGIGGYGGQGQGGTQIGGNGLSGSFTIGTNSSAVLPDNMWCASGTPTWGSADGPATLPTACYNTALANTPSTGAAVSVSTAGQLITALANAACGQQITIQAGVSLVGNFIYPGLSCPTNNLVYIQTSGMASLPVEGTRVSPAYAGVTSLPGRPAYAQPAIPGNYMAQLITSNTSPVLTFTTGASGVRIMGIEFARPSGNGFNNKLISAGNVGNLSNIILDRVWCHGDENIDETQSCIDISGVSYFAVIDSYLNNFYCAAGATHTACESHAIFGGINTNFIPESVIKIVNNFIESASGSIFFGGGAANTTPADIEIRLNTMFKPLTWNPTDPSYNGGLAGGILTVKNLFELKNGQRVLFEGNTLKNLWVGSNQNGSAILLTPKNQQNGAVNQCPLCFVANVTIRYSTINSVGAPFQFVETFNGNGAFPAGLNNVSLHDTVSDNVNYATCSSCGTGTPAFQIWERHEIATVPQTMKNFLINHNTVVYASTSGNPAGSIGLAGPKIATGFNMSGITFTNNVALAGTTGTVNEIGSGLTANCSFGTTGGTNTINACWSPNTFGGNCFITNGSTAWPGSNITSVANQGAAFVSYNLGNGGNYVLSANACQLQGLDGLDPGANIALVNSVLAGNHP